ncbi:pre-rRNA-processing protein esf1-like [Vicia villosa]|uniref:pre-rRNA-processing protein esf1-like n=1 Tax=Vicia villosa TaxID=3911 RepID=UPI00273C2D9D|nr:pre-rRNA-processing protein esf1-like [Vicia villosa]
MSDLITAKEMKNDDNSGLRSMFTRKNDFPCDLRKICLDPEMEEAVNQLDPHLLEQEVNQGIQSSDVFPEMQVVEIEKETHRLAVVNMNWRNAKAVDLYALFYSLVAPYGLIKIKSVAIYPTHFGLQRIKQIKQEEQEHDQFFQDSCKFLKPFLADRFPQDKFIFEERFTSCLIVDDADDDPWKSWPHVLYDIDEKSRYYFAVVECDSCATALEIYKQNDGRAFEQGANPLDLRFIPDHMDFTHPPQDVATVQSLTPSLLTRYSEHWLADNNNDDGGLKGTDTHLKLFLPS